MGSSSASHIDCLVSSNCSRASHAQSKIFNHSIASAPLPTMASASTVLTYACSATIFVATVSAIITLAVLGLLRDAAAVIGPAIRDVNEYLAQIIVFGGAACVVALIGILGCLSRGPEEVRSVKPLAAN